MAETVQLERTGNLIDPILDLSQTPSKDLPLKSREMAKLSLFDWLTCGCAGTEEPLAKALRDFAGAEGGLAVASLFGGGHYPARMAALVNGATSHALDYDDTHFAHIGHLSVGIYPAALAAGEEENASLDAVIEAFLVGAEAAIHIGMALGSAHYDRGFHQTATAGAFGATIAAGRLYNLSRLEMRHAIGLCATRASGLKSQFGTMGKPYNAGIAAANGIECAKLAKCGMTSCEDGLFGKQAFIPTHSDAPVRFHDRDRFSSDPMLFDDIQYKFHACCHGTHAMLEAITTLKRERGLALQDVRKVSLQINPRWMSVCNIAFPQTGLEVKFSYRWLAGMALQGVSTSNEKIYGDSLSQDRDLRAFAEKVEVCPNTALGEMQSLVSVELKSGETMSADHDLAVPLTTPVLQAKLMEKSTVLLGARGASLWEAIHKAEASAKSIGCLIIA